MLLLDESNVETVRNFVAKTTEVCRVEAEQEILLRGKSLDRVTCVRIARGKTGPLFALTASSCAGTDSKLKGALEEAGYCLGTAYQLADDLLDEVGEESQTGKTLGTDRHRKKFTLAQDKDNGHRTVLALVEEQLDAAQNLLAPWPLAQEGVRQFIALDLNPILHRYALAGETL